MSADSTAPLGKEDSETSNQSDDHGELLPVRMLNEFAFCPRLFHFMHVEQRWADNTFTIEGRHVHRRVDQLDHVLPDAEPDISKEASEEPPTTDSNTTTGDSPPTVSRSVPLGSETLGLTAKLDLVATDSDEAVPVETKRGRVPDNPERSWEPERVQLMAQGLLLREHGYHCDHGVLYFADSRTRVDIAFTDELEIRTRELISLARAAANNRTLPPPLDDSPKCKGCSLSGICLPDETLALQLVPADPVHSTDGSHSELTLDGHPIRRLYPPRDDAQPLYVQEQGASVGKSGNRLVIKKEGKQLSSVRLIDLSQLVLCGNISVSTQTLHLLCEAGIPVVYLSMGYWFYGVTHGITLRNAFGRAAQYQTAAQPDRCLSFARQLVADKIANQRTFLRRNATADTSVERAVRDLDDLIGRVPSALSLDSLLGLEGAAAAIYFGLFSRMLRPRDFETTWDFTRRNRRPPRDPINAMLSFLYAILTKECTIALLAEGLDPYWGLYHQPRHGRPALALDLMEPLRPIIADSAAVTAINTGMVTHRDFITSAAGCILEATGRKAMLRAFESRLDQLITHPMFGYRCTWRSAIQLQARLLARWLRGDIPRLENLLTR